LFCGTIPGGTVNDNIGDGVDQMKKFVLLLYGYETPTPEIMEAWDNWFESIEDRMADRCGPFGPGKEITHTGIKELPVDMDALTGYVVINAEDMNEAEAIAGDCPIITSVRIYEVRLH
jgi:hypothetical protein